MLRMLCMQERAIKPGAIWDHGCDFAIGMHEDTTKKAGLKQKLEQLQAQNTSCLVVSQVTIGNSHQNPPGTIDLHERLEELLCDVREVQVASC